MSAQTPAGAPTARPPRAGDPPGASGERDIDFASIAATPEFQALHESRKRFVLGGTLVATAALLIVFGLYGFAPDAMGKPAIGSVTWALVLGFGLILTSFAMAWVFARKSIQWDEMAWRVIDEAGHVPGGGRFKR
jgi:uncharacterized membrane protein (DUF485 family)